MKVFISHSVKGEPEKEIFARNLFEILSKEKLEPFLDLQLLEAGDLWEDKLSNAVESCDAAIILFTKKAIEKSEYILKELLWILAAHREHKIPVLPLYLDNTNVQDIKIDRFKQYELDRFQGLKVNDLRDCISQILAVLKSTSERRFSEFIQSTLLFGDKLSYHDDNDLPSLSNLYIDQRLSKDPLQSNAKDRPENIASQKELQDDETILEALKIYPHILLEGGAGSGKSTLLKHLAVVLASGWKSGDQRDLLPVYVRAPGLAKNSQVLATALYSEVSAYLALNSLPPDFFETAPTKGSHWLVLIDAIDEIYDVSLRKLLSTK